MTVSEAALHDTVERIIRTQLSGTAVDRVDVRPDDDYDGDPILRIDVVLTNDVIPDPRRFFGMVEHIRPALDMVGVERYPILSLAWKSEVGKRGHKRG